MSVEGERVRPGPLRWLAYAYGAGLPPRHRTWVLHDVTTRTWILRHVLRAVIQFLPFAVVLYVALPIDKGIALTGIVMGLVIGVLFSTAYVESNAEHRAIKAGYPEGYAMEMRRKLRPMG